MKKDTQDFLETLLWLADDPDSQEGRGEKRQFQNKTIYDFSDAFIAGAESFIDAFRAHLDTIGFTAWDKMERSFGGNVYFSLSGHGCGFFDDRNDEVSDLQEVIQKWAGDNGRRLRFEELDCMLDVFEDGKIDISFIPSAIEKQREALFTIGK